MGHQKHFPVWKYTILDLQKMNGVIFYVLQHFLVKKDLGNWNKIQRLDKRLKLEKRNVGN